MILATDVHYTGEEAVAAAVLFEEWKDSERLHEWAESRTGAVEQYSAGEFFRRELPCILPLIRRAYQSLHLKAIIVDGYVDLGGGKPGLGRYLKRALGGRVEVIGVAKNEFVGAPAAEVLRGKSMKPLFVTTTGNMESAARRIRSMAGEHRIPEMLRRVDELSRGARPKR
ncbi:MAG: deoxyribonuclease V [Polyangiales bacterium]|jgi:deoxyribonuclease V